MSNSTFWVLCLLMVCAGASEIAMFALLALAGDLGGSVGHGLVGVISQNMGYDLRIGVLAGVCFPVILILCVCFLIRKDKQCL